MSLLGEIIKDTPPSQFADTLVEHISLGLEVEEMRRARGRHYTKTDLYQLRIKPVDKSMALEDILLATERYLKSEESQALGISDVQINERSKNSGKYASVSFKANGKNFDAVIAKGSNAGETFEKDLLLKMDALVSKETLSLDLGDVEHAKSAFAALEKVDPVFALKNIASVSPRSGTTRGAGRRSLADSAEIIGDIVVKLKNGEKKYISVKSARGATIAQFGLVKAFTDDLKVNTASTEWKQWLEPFGLSVRKIERGLKAAKNQTDLPWSDIDRKVKKVPVGSSIYKILQRMWGVDYYLLKELPRGGFTATKIDSDHINKKLLRNLEVIEVRYPSKDRKQINIYLKSDTTKFKIEVRNPRGSGAVKPTQIQLTVLKGTER